MSLPAGLAVYGQGAASVKLMLVDENFTPLCRAGECKYEQAQDNPDGQ